MRRSDIFGLLGIALVTICGLWLFKSEAGKALTGRWSFVHSVEVDKGSYFRLKVKLAYKGQPANFDIVVGCNVRQINYKDGSNTYEVGLVPTVFGKRMDDGKGVVLRAPDACRGETSANGWVPPDFMPLIVLFDDADTWAYGTAYMSPDAYTNPLSVLTFGGAVIEKATREEFDLFRKEQPNPISRESYHSKQNNRFLKERGLSRATPALGTYCRMYARFRVPESAKAAVHALWPTDRPRYWIPAEQDPGTRLLWDEITRAGHITDLGDKIPGVAGGVYSDGFQYHGLTNRRGGGRIMPPHAEKQPTPIPSFYPVQTDNTESIWPKDRLKWPEFLRDDTKRVAERIDVRDGQTRGFATCWKAPAFDDDIPGDSNAQTSRWRMREAIFSVDGIPVTGAPTQMNRWMRALFDRDGYYFIVLQFGLESTRGDV